MATLLATQVYKNKVLNKTMKNFALILVPFFLFACAEEEISGPVYDTAGVERHTIEVVVSSAGVVEPLATVEVKSKA